MRKMKRKVNLFAIGDIFLGLDGTELIEKDYKFPFLCISNVFKEADLVFGNLEGPLSNDGKPIKKSSQYSPPTAIHSLKYAGFNVLSLANNHIFDYGERAFLKTIELMEKNNISYVGAGRNLEEARRAALFHINEVNIAFLAYSWDFIGSVNATNSCFGTAPLKADIIEEDILSTKELADIIIVSLHWGYERERYPLPSQRNLAHKIIDAGADLIIGHHPHVLQGIEHYKDGVIAYSLGNFVFTAKSYFKMWGNEEKESIILKCGISKKGIEKIDMIPIHVSDSFQLVILKNERKKESLSRMESLSEHFQGKNYLSFWKKNRIRKDLPDIYKFQIDKGIVYKLYKSRMWHLILKHI